MNPKFTLDDEMRLNQIAHKLLSDPPRVEICRSPRYDIPNGAMEYNEPPTIKIELPMDHEDQKEVDLIFCHELGHFMDCETEEDKEGLTLFEELFGYNTTRVVQLEYSAWKMGLHHQHGIEVCRP